MFDEKIFKLTLLMLFTISIMLLASDVGAKIQMYTATGEDYANEVESQDIAKLRARDKAIKKATKQAGVYLKTYSRSVNSELTDDEVTAITSNAWQLVSEPKYSSKIVKGSDETSIIIWTATVEVNVDDSEIQSWIKRDDKDKSTIITQTREAQKVSEENERKIEDLREKYNRATSQAEKDSLRKQMTDADRDFLANQKFEEGNKLFFSKNYEGAIKFYDEALQLNPKNAEYYSSRGDIYILIKNYDKAICDFVSNIEFDDDIDFTNYIGLQISIFHAKAKSEQNVKSLTKLIKLKPDSISYFYRGFVYVNRKDYELAIKDFNKSIELGSNNSWVYNTRGQTHYYLKNYNQAIADLNKAIKIGLKGYDLGECIYYRGLCYQALGYNKKAQVDFAKAKELGWKD